MTAEAWAAFRAEAEARTHRCDSLRPLPDSPEIYPDPERIFWPEREVRHPWQDLDGDRGRGR
jgi:hypothetical protein